MLEHAQDPIKSVNEVWRVLTPCGMAIHTTCFFNYYHPAPIDYWRFSPDALCYMHKALGEVVTYGGWGSHLAAALCMLGDRFRAIEIPERRYSLRRYLATTNNEKYPISTWIIAIK